MFAVTDETPSASSGGPSSWAALANFAVMIFPHPRKKHGFMPRILLK
jgi:hypothetical protein